jgi:hypothetical protein
VTRAAGVGVLRGTRRARVLPGATLLLASAGCLGDDASSPSPRAAVIVASAVAANPHNVLSVVVTAHVRDADSVTVRYGRAGAPLADAAPAVVPDGDIAIVPVLGLHTETHYRLQVAAFGGGETVNGAVLDITTGPLPQDLPTYVAGGPDPSDGYVVFAAGAYGIVIDNSGRVVWYRRFPRGPGLNFQAQPTGRYTARPPPSDPSQPATWVELDALGNVTRTLGCARALQPRFHDLIASADGSYWILCDETRSMDLTAAGGVADAVVTGTVIQHVSGTGALLFEWSAFDHFAITDLPPEERTGALVNWTHGNAIDLDGDGNLLISFRSLNEITRIDTRTGNVLWRMGGLRNQFAFDAGEVPPFARQHGVRATGTGRILLLDNLGDPTSSRAKRYEYDEVAHTARLVGSYGSEPPVVAQLGGTTQDLPGGRALVSFGNAGRVEEYDAAGRVAWSIEQPGYVFRAQRIASLYRPGAN